MEFPKKLSLVTCVTVITVGITTLLLFPISTLARPASTSSSSSIPLEPQPTEKLPFEGTDGERVARGFPNLIPNPNLNPSLPNTALSIERFFGVGLAFPYPYFQKPTIRYPVYDRNGQSISPDSYGFGGPEAFHYTKFTPYEVPLVLQ